MPRYSWSVSDIIFEEDATKIYNATNNRRDTVLVCLLWLTGARPSELQALKRSDLAWDENTLIIRLITKKLGAGKDFRIEDRELKFIRPQGVNINRYLESLIRYCQPLDAGTVLLPYGNRWFERHINGLTESTLNKKLSPYHFRHSVMTWLMRNGATVEQVMHFKGSKDIKSVQMYLHAVPYVIKLENLRRTHGLEITQTSQALVQL